ncbi:hypothetical protein AHiyo8_43140 [Arthrobacter sp. Hiyo8]|nr:hypothetical protein AHiyo8_43140 [Arthrobacter sp. Hiyo8]
MDEQGILHHIQSLVEEERELREKAEAARRVLRMPRPGKAGAHRTGPGSELGPAAPAAGQEAIRREPERGQATAPKQVEGYTG